MYIRINFTDLRDRLLERKSHRNLTEISGQLHSRSRRTCGRVSPKSERQAARLPRHAAAAVRSHSSARCIGHLSQHWGAPPAAAEFSSEPNESFSLMELQPGQVDRVKEQEQR